MNNYIDNRACSICKHEVKKKVYSGIKIIKTVLMGQGVFQSTGPSRRFSDDTRLVGNDSNRRRWERYMFSQNLALLLYIVRKG